MKKHKGKLPATKVEEESDGSFEPKPFETKWNLGLSDNSENFGEEPKVKIEAGVSKKSKKIQKTKN